MAEMTREKTIALTVAAIERQFGKGAIMQMSGKDGPADAVPVIPSGSLSLDIATGVGGYPMGRVIEIFGPESSGKTTLALHAIAQTQKGGGVAAFIDAEHALDIFYARKLGIRTEDLLVSQPDTGEQALEIADYLVRSNAVGIVVVDSVAALVPKAEIEGEMGDSHMGLQARLMSQALRKLTGSISRSHTCVVFINQIRMKLGVLYGSPETTTGGNALKFYASMRLDIRRLAHLKRGEEIIGNRARVKVVKNKLAPPFKEAEFDIIYGTGISRESDTLDIAVKQGIIEKSGAWYSFKGDRLGQGKENVRQYMIEHPELTDELEARVREQFNMPLRTPQAADWDPRPMLESRPARTTAAPADEAPEELD